MSGALSGIRVVDFGQYVAGPLAGMLLADQGADVIKIDPPGGPRWQTPANSTWNRGKRSVVLDLKQSDGLEIARALIQSADILVENFRPGVMDRLGLGFEASIASNPGIIYCSLPGFASDDPRAGIPAWEGVVGAAAGVYRETPGGAPDQRPVYTAIPISSSYAAFIGVTSISMALNARARDGIGQYIEVPMYDATFTASADRAMRVHSQPPRGTRGGSPWVRQYECADGQWIMLHGSTTRFIEQFVRVAGVEKWRQETLLDRALVAADPALTQLLSEKMVTLFKTRTSGEWEDLINGAGTPAAICRESWEWLDHPQARDTQMVIEVDDLALGRIVQPGVNPRLEVTPGLVRGPAPALDADRATLLAELETYEHKPKSLNDDDGSALRPALDGIKVLDLCIILAGPICGRTLGEFGANVIKIDSPHREGGVSRHNEVNRGKRSLLIDLKSDAGLELFWQLLEDCDVVVQNFRTGVAESLGIGYEEVRKRKPSIIYASLNAYGHGGPWDERPGWEQLAQAATGMQKRFGGDGPPVLQQFPINDCGTGLMGAYAVALALLHRGRTGEGQHVRGALAYTGCTLQSPFLLRFPGKTWDEPRGQTRLGSGPLHRAYRARDRWIFLGAPETLLQKLEMVDGLRGIAGMHGTDLEAALERKLQLKTADEWVKLIAETGVGVQPVKTASENLDDPWAKAHGLSMTREHEDIGLITTVGPAPRLSRTPIRPGYPAPKPGSNADEVLSEHGLANQYKQLVQAGAVVIEGVSAR
jgi:crotonobetainyl-CoA:carnitine CoA-transferase CaiB-like acyl-CoA transferase